MNGDAAVIDPLYGLDRVTGIVRRQSASRSCSRRLKKIQSRVFPRSTAVSFFMQLTAISPLLRRAQDTIFAVKSTRGIPVNYFAQRARHCVKVPYAAAVHGPPASSHRLTLANSGATHYRFPC
jgi:hypothetical protein